MNIKPYKKDYDYSYSLGVFPTIELLKARPKAVREVILSSRGVNNQGIRTIMDLCSQRNIPWKINDKNINRLSSKENCYAIGIFNKEDQGLSKDFNHIVLVNPGDMGNLGTIIRTALGFNITDIGIIRPAVDAYNPKVIRGSMGSFFKVRLEYFHSFDDYLAHHDRHIFTFRLNGETTLDKVTPDYKNPYSLVFGNESSGLGPEFDKVGYGVRIFHSKEIDSLNLAVAAGIALNHFANPPPANLERSP